MYEVQFWLTLWWISHNGAEYPLCLNACCSVIWRLIELWLPISTLSVSCDSTRNIIYILHIMFSTCNAESDIGLSVRLELSVTTTKLGWWYMLINVQISYPVLELMLHPKWWQCSQFSSAKYYRCTAVWHAMSLISLCILSLMLLRITH